MASITSFLRDLAAKATVHVDAVVAHTIWRLVSPSRLWSNTHLWWKRLPSPTLRGCRRQDRSGSPAAEAVAPRRECLPWSRCTSSPSPSRHPTLRKAGNGSKPTAATPLRRWKPRKLRTRSCLPWRTRREHRPLSRGHLAPPSFAIPIAEGDSGEAGVAVLPIETVRARRDSGPPAAGSSVAVVSNATMLSIAEIFCGECAFRGAGAPHPPSRRCAPRVG